MEWVLAVDLGTTFTAAAVAPREGVEPPRVVRLGSRSDLMPSGVLRTSDGLVVGERAEAQVGAYPGAFEGRPKTRFGEGAVMLGHMETADHELAAAILKHVAEKARREHNGRAPGQLVLTHPAGWRQRRLSVLERAAGLAELPNPTWCPEPVAAAAYYAQKTRTPAGATLAVYDLGGGTLDLALLRTGNGHDFEVLGQDGDRRMGGEWFDEKLCGWVFDQLQADGHTDVVEWLRTDPGARRTFNHQVTEAKEQLSDYPDHSIPIPGHRPLSITRTELNDLIQDELRAAAERLTTLLRTHQLTPDDLHELFLTGGSTHIPLVTTVLKEHRFQPATLDDPKTVTCLGALYHHRHPQPPARDQGPQHPEPRRPEQPGTDTKQRTPTALEAPNPHVLPPPVRRPLFKRLLEFDPDPPSWVRMAGGLGLAVMIALYILSRSLSWF